jgi:pimeloyl-ACP methyl ester carboxylesterase
MRVIGIIPLERMRTAPTLPGRTRFPRSRIRILLTASLVPLCIGSFLLASSSTDSNAPERLVDVGGYRLQCRVMGNGRPAVVFLNGGSASMDYWEPVAPSIAEHATVVTYERAGHGQSEMGREPRHGENIARELRALLESLGIEGPYVVVAHSAGCMYARIFAGMYPELVTGMVLLDPGDKDFLDAFAEKHLEGEKRQRWIEHWDQTWGKLSERPGALGQEIQYKDTTLKQMLTAKLAPDLELFVVSGLDESRPSPFLQSYGEEVIHQYYRQVRAYHLQLAGTSSRGQQIPVVDAGHVIHRDRPDIVIELIQKLP